MPFAPSRHRLLLVSIAVAVGASFGIWRLISSETPEQVYRRAKAAAQSGDSTTAIPLLDDVLRREPTHVEALLYRGQLAAETGDPDAALEVPTWTPIWSHANTCQNFYILQDLWLNALELRIAARDTEGAPRKTQ